MEVKNLLLFNKEGGQMNLNYDESLDLWNGKMFFDKNSTETFKTQGIYTFEKVIGSNNTFQAYLDKFQVFNTNNFLAFPKFNATELQILDIKTTTDSSNYYTKWIYAEGIEKSFYPGMWVYFEGLNGYSGTDFDKYNGGFVQARKVFTVEPGRILVLTETANNTPLPAFVASSGIKVIPMNVMEVQQVQSGLPAEPSWNEINLDTKVYDGKKISIVADSENTGIYTHKEPVLKRFREALLLSPTAYSPNPGDKLVVTLTLNVSNIPVSNGITTFTGNDIIVPYIPSFLKVGDFIQAFAKTVPLSLLNDVTLTVTAIDRNTNTITVSTPLTLQTVDCTIDLATNVMTIEQDIVLDNNNVYSLPLTYWTLVTKWSEILNSIPGGGILQYIPDTDELLYTSNFSDSYSTITFDIFDITNTIFPIIYTPIIYDIYPLWLEEPLAVEERIVKDSTTYYRDIVFTEIDNFGLNVNINGIDYNVDQDFDVNPIITVSNTIGDFITEYAAVLAQIGVIVTQTTSNNPGDTLNIQGEFPNVPIFTQLRMGDFANYNVKYKSIEFNNIKSQLIITINEQNYYIPFNTDDITTVSDWVSTHEGVLGTFGIKVVSFNNIIYFDLLDPERTLDITYNIGYIPKSGDLSVYEILTATPASGSVIAGNEIKVVTGTYNFFDYYSTGQKITIDGAVKLTQNKSYNIISLESDIISLSYQGAFWQQGLPVFSLNIVSDYFIRFPKYGLSDYANNARLIWSWKDTQNPDFFFYDFTGDQLKPIYDNFPEYSGIKPLCGPNGEIELKLISKPNDKLELVSDPTKQQTVFDKIEYTIPYIDNNETAGIEPQPLQMFMGYRADFESWNKARAYLELIEDVTFNLTTDSNLTDNLTDDLWVFKDNTLEVQSVSMPFDFNVQGFKVGQVVQIDATDVNVDNKNIATLNNAGKKVKITKVQPNKLTFAINLLDETSIKQIPKTTPPYYDNAGNPLMEYRTMNVKLTVLPKMVAYIDVYGESEEEDVRHKINLNNRNLNILKLQDFYIFKEVDIKEQGIDWIILNRKRKELLEIYPELFNNLASYKSVIKAINFFGYNDLSFTEYFQNINPESSKFGQLFNMELLNIFDKSVQGWEYSNLAYENLRNSGFRKTNLFSLNYKITDTDGNFVNAYSLEEVRIKLLGLKKWLTENIIPIGTKIIDITGKYVMPQQFTLQHDTYLTQNFRVEEYATPVDFSVTGYLSPISTGSDTYNLSVQFFSAGEIEWFEYRIRTFYLEEWSDTINYVVNDTVYHNGVAWKCLNSVNPGDEPGVTSSWEQINIDSLPSNQIIRDYRYDDTGTSFTVNKLIDPHFIVEVSWHSGYSSALLNRKVYSVIPDFFKNMTI